MEIIEVVATLILVYYLGPLLFIFGLMVLLIIENWNDDGKIAEEELWKARKAGKP